MGKALNASRLQFAEHVRNVWIINPEYGVTPEDILEPSYFAHVANSLKPWDKIEARSEDGSYYAEYVVEQAGRSFAKLAMVHLVTLAAKIDLATEVAEAYQVIWKGPQYKWRVVRKKDNQTLKDGIASKGDALRWVQEHQKAVEI